MQLESDNFKNNERIPERNAFGKRHATEHMELGDNLSPQLSWTDVPFEAKSLVLICVDTDVPSSPDGINTEGYSISPELPRVEFFHWLMSGLRPEAGELDEGACSQGVSIGGKQRPAGPTGTQQGSNDYTDFLAGNKDMEGTYRGYDGPCPPWNDELLHHYRFKLYALDTDNLNLSPDYSGQELMAAIRGHVIDQVELTGVYSLNPALD